MATFDASIVLMHKCDARGLEKIIRELLWSPKAEFAYPALALGGYSGKDSNLLALREFGKPAGVLDGVLHHLIEMLEFNIQSAASPDLRAHDRNQLVQPIQLLLRHRLSRY